MEAYHAIVRISLQLDPLDWPISAQSPVSFCHRCCIGGKFSAKQAECGRAACSCWHCPDRPSQIAPHQCSLCQVWTPTGSVQEEQMSRGAPREDVLQCIAGQRAGDDGVHNVVVSWPNACHRGGYTSPRYRSRCRVGIGVCGKVKASVDRANRSVQEPSFCAWHMHCLHLAGHYMRRTR